MLKDYFIMLSYELILIISVLVGVAFLTLMERKVLSYIQLRKGPNKLGMMGFMQPFSDAIKLFSKESLYPYKSNFNLFYLSPILNLILALLMWLVVPYLTIYMSFRGEVLFMLCLMSMSVYTIMFSGWSSNSNYSMLGSIRSLSQTISYEVGMFLILMVFILLVKNFKLSYYFIYQKEVWFFLLCLPVSLMWVVISLAETNRTPFDLAEGESELVSGFNVEYSSGGFALIFLAEYANILFMSLLCTLLFLGGNLFYLSFYIKLLIMSFFWIWVRGTLPRYRYDNLMYLIWKIYLPNILSLIIFYYLISLMVYFF